MPNPDTHPVSRTAIAAAHMLEKLEPGPLAELRRMDISAGAAGFWRLAAQHPATINDKSLEDWMAIVHILALLTPKGDPADRKPLHDAKRRLGEVLCDGGDPNWPNSNSPRPVLSEQRLARLMATRGRQRGVLLRRAVSAVSRTRQSDSGINVVDIAWTLLDSDIRRTGRRIAEPYYRRLDRAERNNQADQEGEKE